MTFEKIRISLNLYTQINHDVTADPAVASLIACVYEHLHKYTTQTN